MENITRIWFEEEKKPYKVRAMNERFLICTKPYNFRPGTVLYTIVDMEAGIRGTDSWIFSPYDYASDKDCHEALKDLDKGKMWVSVRNNIPLKITKTK